MSTRGNHCLLRALAYNGAPADKKDAAAMRRFRERIAEAVLDRRDLELNGKTLEAWVEADAPGMRIDTWAEQYKSTGMMSDQIVLRVWPLLEGEAVWVWLPVASAGYELLPAYRFDLPSGAYGRVRHVVYRADELHYNALTVQLPVLRRAEARAAVSSRPVGLIQMGGCEKASERRTSPSTRASKPTNYFAILDHMPRINASVDVPPTMTLPQPRPRPAFGLSRTLLKRCRRRLRNAVALETLERRACRARVADVLCRWRARTWHAPSAFRWRANGAAQPEPLASRRAVMWRSADVRPTRTDALEQWGAAAADSQRELISRLRICLRRWMELLVLVKPLSGSTRQLALPRRATFATLAARLCARDALPEALLRVMHNGKLLLPGVEVRLRRDDELRVELRAPLRGGMQNDDGSASASSEAMSAIADPANDAQLRAMQRLIWNGSWNKQIYKETDSFKKADVDLTKFLNFISGQLGTDPFKDLETNVIQKISSELLSPLSLCNPERFQGWEIKKGSKKLVKPKGEKAFGPIVNAYMHFGLVSKEETTASSKKETTASDLEPILLVVGDKNAFKIEDPNVQPFEEDADQQVAGAVLDEMLQTVLKKVKDAGQHLTSGPAFYESELKSLGQAIKDAEAKLAQEQKRKDELDAEIKGLPAAIDFFRNGLLNPSLFVKENCQRELERLEKRKVEVEASAQAIPAAPSFDDSAYPILNVTEGASLSDTQQAHLKQAQEHQKLLVIRAMTPPAAGECVGVAFLCFAPVNVLEPLLVKVVAEWGDPIDNWSMPGADPGLSVTLEKGMRLPANDDLVSALKDSIADAVEALPYQVDYDAAGNSTGRRELQVDRANLTATLTRVEGSNGVGKDVNPPGNMLHGASMWSDFADTTYSKHPDCGLVETITLRCSNDAVKVNFLDPVPPSKGLAPAVSKIFKPQWEVGQRLVDRALELLKDDHGDVPEYQGVMFFVITANFNTLKQQTNDRLHKEGLRMPEKGANGKNYEKGSEAWLWNLGTITYCLSSDNTQAYEEFRKHAFEHPETLHVIVADECHSAITLNGAYDYYVNDHFNKKRQGELRKQSNVLTLLVSATPFNVVSSKSYLALSNGDDLKEEENIVYWFDGPSTKTTPYVRMEDCLQSSADDELALCQRMVRRDPAFKNMCSKCKDASRDYLLLADYLFSFAYFSAFRWDEDKGFLKPLSECKTPEATDDERVNKWLKSFNEYRCPALVKNATVEDLCKARSEILKLGSNVALDDEEIKQKLCKLADGKLKEEMGDDAESYLLTTNDITALSETDRIVLDLLRSSQKLEVTTAMMEATLDQAKKAGKTDEEAQQLAKQEQKRGYLRGHMKIIRVNPNLGDRTIGRKFSSVLRHARDQFFCIPTGPDRGQFDGYQSCAFAVLMDMGEQQESLNGSFNGREKGFLHVPLLDDTGKKVFCLDEKLSAEHPKLTYDDLHSLPCILLLVEKGRMGDTFPQSFDTLDLRIRVSDNLSTFVQELGRMCRYASYDPLDREDLATHQAKMDEANKIFAAGEQVGVGSKTKTGSIDFIAFASSAAKLKRLLDAEPEDRAVLLKVRHRMPCAVVVEQRMGKVEKAIAEAKMVNALLAEQQMAPEQKAAAAAAVAEAAATAAEVAATAAEAAATEAVDLSRQGAQNKKAVEEHAKTAADKASNAAEEEQRAYAQLDTAADDDKSSLVRQRARQAQQMASKALEKANGALKAVGAAPRECAPLKADDFARSAPAARERFCQDQPNLPDYAKMREDKAVRAVEVLDCLRLGSVDSYLKPSGKTASLQIVPNHNNPSGVFKNELVNYKSNYRPDNTSTSKNLHMRDNIAPHKQRLLLWAETQIGKTGAFCAFLHYLREHFPTPYNLPAPPRKHGNYGPELRWQLPHWKSLGTQMNHGGSPKFQYGKLKFGKYFVKVRSQRLGYLLKIFDGNSDDIARLDECVVDMIKQEECIKTAIGLKHLRVLSSELKKHPNSPPIRKEGSGFRVGNEVLLKAVLNWDERQVWDPTSENADQRSLGFSDLIVVGSDGTYFEVPKGVKPLNVHQMAWGAHGEKKGKAADDAVDVAPAVHANLVPQPHHFLARRKLSGQVEDLNASTVEYMIKKSDPSSELELRLKNVITTLGAVIGSDVRVSWPKSWPNIFEFDTQQKLVKARGHEGGVRCWIFTPSFGRANHALLDRSKALRQHASGDTMQVDQGAATPIQALVVRSDDYDAYREHWGEMYVIIELPSTIVIKEHLVNASVSDGVGFSRLFIQLFARAMKLDFVWMLDDNVHGCWKLNIKKLCAAQAHTVQPASCPFTDPMMMIESLVLDAEKTTVGEEDLLKTCREVSEHPTMKLNLKFWPKSVSADPDTSPRLNPKERVLAPSETSLKQAQFTGTPKHFGLIGIGRDPDRYEMINTPFAASPSTYSFVLLNVRDTVDAGVLYPPKKFWQDIEFNHMLEESNFIVLKVRTFMHVKSNLQPKNPSAESVREPTELELKLNEMLHLQGGQICGGANRKDSKAYHVLFKDAPETDTKDPLLKSILTLEGKTEVPDAAPFGIRLLLERPKETLKSNSLKAEDRIADEITLVSEKFKAQAAVFIFRDHSEYSPYLDVLKSYAGVEVGQFEHLPDSALAGDNGKFYVVEVPGLEKPLYCAGFPVDCESPENDTAAEHVKIITKHVESVAQPVALLYMKMGSAGSKAPTDDFIKAKVLPKLPRDFDVCSLVVAKEAEDMIKLTRPSLALNAVIARVALPDFNHCVCSGIAYLVSPQGMQKILEKDISNAKKIKDVLNNLVKGHEAKVFAVKPHGQLGGSSGGTKRNLDASQPPSEGKKLKRDG